MKNYKHLFFDLDNTLWDFEKNSAEALLELYDKYDFQKRGVPSPETFIRVYKERNAMMWEQYRLGVIDKAALRNDRFRLTFWDLGLDTEEVPPQLADDYLLISPQKKHLFPHAHEVLDYLAGKYKLHIITNGFEEVQSIKLKSCDLDRYFDRVIISEHTGFKKPDIGIFKYSLAAANAKSDESLMIGDGLEIDVAGAREAGWDTVYFNPENIPHEANVTYEIKSLHELLQFL